MTGRHAYLAASAAALAAFIASVAPARSDDPAAAQVLPNLRQQLPTDVAVAQTDGEWRLGFASEVTNDGPGYLKITGNGPGTGPMVADQIVQMTDNTATTVPGVGVMHYVIGGGHEHWHLLDFERYELRAASDPSTPVVKDQKTGFCLADAFTSDACGRNKPALTTVSEGISANGRDKYLGYLEGQYLVLDPVTTPAGDYLLVNRVNPTGSLLDGDTSDDAASLRLQLAWSAAGKPSVTITNFCPASIDCPPPPPKPIPDPPDPPPSPGDPQPPAPDQQQTTTDSVVPAPDPQPVPIVSPAEFGSVAARATMSRSMAGRLVWRAIQKSTKHAPRRLRTTCDRRGRMTFVCSSNWRGAAGARWRGRVRVWYVDRSGLLSWFYTLSARPAGGEVIVRRSVRGSASRAVFSGAGGSLFCARID